MEFLHNVSLDRKFEFKIFLRRRQIRLEIINDYQNFQEYLQSTVELEQIKRILQAKYLKILQHPNEFHKSNYKIRTNHSFIIPQTKRPPSPSQTTN